MTKQANSEESIDRMAERPEKKKSAPEASYSLEDLKTLFSLMKTNDIGELDLEQKGTKIRIVSTRAMVYPQAAMPAMQPFMHSVAPVGMMPAQTPPVAHPAPAPQAEAPAAAGQPAAAEVPSNLKTILSPMVGTFYRAPAPDADPFVQVGDQVKEDSVLCIIEAMKLMNEIKAETKGRISKILVENGVPVEYNQPLFLIEPL